MRAAIELTGRPDGIALTAIWLILAVLTCGAHAADPASSTSRILLLHNGQSLQGQITPLGDHYLVTLPRGEIRIPGEQVEGICNSMDEVYLRRSNAVRFGHAVDHLKLAQWCLDQDLRQRAQQQLDLAVGKQPNHPRIALIERQLAAAVNAHSPAKVTATYTLPEHSAMDLEDVVRKMPKGTTESFTKSIQPVLLNSCSARACHGSAGDNDFHLIKFARGQLLPRRLTLRNLNAVLNWIDRKQPLNSPLLRYAVQPHGDKRPAALSSTGRPYALLAEWVGEVLGEDAASPQPVDTFVTARPAFRYPRNGALGSGVAEPVLQNPNPFHATPAPPAPETGDVEPRGHAGPKDPFDPDIFNRRYHPTKR